jgi:hypothetical protein
MSLVMPVVKNSSATADPSIDAGQTAEPLACKSWADRVPQCGAGVRPRKIFGSDLEPSAAVPGSLLHRCYIAARLLLSTKRYRSKMRILAPTEGPMTITADVIAISTGQRVLAADRNCVGVK